MIRPLLCIGLSLAAWGAQSETQEVQHDTVLEAKAAAVAAAHAQENSSLASLISSLQDLGEQAQEDTRIELEERDAERQDHEQEERRVEHAMESLEREMEELERQLEREFGKLEEEFEDQMELFEEEFEREMEALEESLEADFEGWSDSVNDDCDSDCDDRRDSDCDDDCDSDPNEANGAVMRSMMERIERLEDELHQSRSASHSSGSACCCCCKGHAQPQSSSRTSYRALRAPQAPQAPQAPRAPHAHPAPRAPHAPATVSSHSNALFPEIHSQVGTASQTSTTDEIQSLISEMLLEVRELREVVRGMHSTVDSQ
ncbi:MAG: hypothetical protein ACI8X5_000801 [Planctomycetota bacterium]|jgi:hypothetical protein